MKKSKKNYVIIALIVLLLALAIGYAAFSTSLMVDGTAEGTGIWDVHFTSAALKDSTGAADTKHGTATVKNATTVEANVTLAYPGDAVLLETVIENSGNLPAKLTAFNITGADDDLTITGGAPTTNETVAANGGTCTSQYVIKWAADSTATTLNKTFTITFDYSQDTTEVNITPTHTDA